MTVPDSNVLGSAILWASVTVETNKDMVSGNLCTNDPLDFSLVSS